MPAKENIYTIPVTDAFSQTEECPFCHIYRTLEDEALAFIMDTAYMEDYVRLETDAKGFCAAHYQRMYAMPNRLGLALMLHTHTKALNARLRSLAKAAAAPQKSPFTRDKIKAARQLTEYIGQTASACYVCDRIEQTFTRYVDTFFYMWDHHPEIRALLPQGAGFCLKHFGLATAKGAQALGDKSFAAFAELTFPKQLAAMETLEQDLEWFTKKFDYRYKDEPWKNAKDALPRAIRQLSGGNVAGNGNSEA